MALPYGTVSSRRDGRDRARDGGQGDGGLEGGREELSA